MIGRFLPVAGSHDVDIGAVWKYSGKNSRENP